MDIPSRTTTEGFALRTRKNLDFIKNAREQRCEDVHIVTQLVTSLLGLVVWPRERYDDSNNIWKIHINDLVRQGWPEWDITPGKSNTKTLGDLIPFQSEVSMKGLVEV